jgi:hypothetical protein
MRVCARKPEELLRKNFTDDGAAPVKLRVSDSNSPGVDERRTYVVQTPDVFTDRLTISF